MILSLCNSMKKTSEGPFNDLFRPEFKFRYDKDQLRKFEYESVDSYYIITRRLKMEGPGVKRVEI